MPIDIAKAKKFLSGHRNRQAALGISKGSSSDIFMIKQDGKYKVRIIDMDEFMIGDHWGVLNGKEGKSGPPIGCPKAYDNSDCPVCEYAEHLMKNGETDEEKKRGKGLQVKTAYPVLLLDMDNVQESAKPLIYKAPYTVYRELIEWLDSDDCKDMMDLEKGRDVTITRGVDPRSGMTSYSVKVSFKSTPVKVDPKLMINLRSASKPLSYEDLEYALENGELPEKKEAKAAKGLEFSKTETKAPSQYSKNRPSVKDVEDEEEQEVETEKVEDVEETRAPTKRSLKAEEPEEDDVPDPELPEKPTAIKTSGPSRLVRAQLEKLKAKKEAARSGSAA